MMSPKPATLHSAVSGAISRRSVLIGAAGSAALLSVGARGALGLTHGLFTLGVASGDPSPDGVVLWTRLAPVPLDPDGGMPPVAVPVRWEVADDERFGRIVQSGVAQAHPRWGIRCMSTSRGCVLHVAISTVSSPAVKQVPRVGRSLHRRPAQRSIDFASVSDRARNTRSGSTAPIAIWSPRTRI